MKNVFFKKAKGLQISENVLKLLKSDKEFKEYCDKRDVDIYVGCFTNCREAGFTYNVSRKDSTYFTFCTYEHRNSDSIIINGKSGYISMSGDLPYVADSKWSYLASAECGDYKTASDKLKKLIKKFINNKK